MKPHHSIPLIAASLLPLLAPTIHAATITETTDAGGGSGTGSGVNSDYSAALYGTPAAAPTAGNNYVTAANLGGGGTTDGIAYTTRIRINDVTNTANAGTINTFQGNSLELVGGVELLDKTLGGNGASVNLILDGGSLFDEAANANGTTSLAGSIQVNTGVATLGLDQSGSAVLNVNSVITGTGTLALFGFLGNTPNTVNLNGNINAFDGTFNLSTGGTYDITTNAVAAGATLNVSQTSAVVDLTNNLTLGGLVDGSTTIHAGTYTAAQLNTLDGNSDFVDASNSKTVTVIPEPQIGALVLLGMGGLLLIRRRQQSV